MVGAGSRPFLFHSRLHGGNRHIPTQIATLVSPAVPHTSACVSHVNWTQAASEIEAYAHSPINRIYAPTAPDTRFRFRMMTDRDAIYSHVIYDACTGKVLGSANLAWMDWLVDFHHNLRADHAGRLWGGWIGLVLFLSSMSGLIIWLLSRPGRPKFLKIRAGVLMARDLHATMGIFATLLLSIASFSGLWLCFPQTMRAGLNLFSPLPREIRPPRPAKPPEGTPTAGLGDIFAAAERAIPGGVIREIRLPEGYSNVQVRMWRPGDFRSLGNNVVTVDRVSAAIVATDLYSSKPAANRFMQAMAGLHYGEWGGLPYRTLYGLAGLVSALLFVTGILVWWLPKSRARAAIRKSETYSDDPTTAKA